MKFDRVSVAIIGGGASGTILAAQLARRGVDSLLIDGSGRLGRGVAYSTREPAHLLNVRAEGMSAWAGQADHFADWFKASGGEPRGFAERRLFGRYLGEILDEAIASGHVHVARESATAARRSGGSWRIELDNGRQLDASALALAIGNQPPEPISAFSSAGRRFIANPWGEDAEAAIRDVSVQGQSVMLVGTGLTMVDLVLSLTAAGHQGKIMALSRRGQIPRAHADFDPAPVDFADLPSGGLLALWRWLRRRSAEVGWRAAIDSLRPHSRALWQALDGPQQRRFLRHARPWWDVHRHRIAPDVAKTLTALIADGRLEIVAGRIIAAQPAESSLRIDIRRRHSGNLQTRHFAYAFNCTGPLHSIARSHDPLLRSLLDSGLARVDGLGIGIEVDEKSRVAGSERLWALGPLTKGRYWEIVAVPDIREQAADVAADMTRELSR